MLFSDQAARHKVQTTRAIPEYTTAIPGLTASAVLDHKLPGVPKVLAAAPEESVKTTDSQGPTHPSQTTAIGISGIGPRNVHLSQVPQLI